MRIEYTLSFAHLLFISKEINNFSINIIAATNSDLRPTKIKFLNHYGFYPRICIRTDIIPKQLNRNFESDSDSENP